MSKLCRELLAVSRRAGKAMMDFQMVSPGDRIAVAVSGGKDSLSLLHVLRHRRQVTPFDWEFTAVHVDFGFPDFSPEELFAYLDREGFPYFLEKVETLKGQQYQNIDCYLWSRARRKALFEMCAREGYNKIAFGHHLDDIAETILLNQFYRGETGAMRPVQSLFDGKITLIRPLAYEREERMVELSQALGIHTMGQSKCANDDTSHRMLIKKMLREFEQHNPGIVKNIFNSLQNIREDYLIPSVAVGADKE